MILPPAIEPLVEKLTLRGATLTDKALLSLGLAADDAKQLRYRDLYDDNLFTGVIRSLAAATGLFQSLGIDPIEIVNRVHAPLLDPRREYRKDYSKTRHRKDDKWLRKRTFIDSRDMLGGLDGNITSETLFLASLQMPVVVQALQDYSISANKVRRHAERLRIIEPDIESQKLIIGVENNRFTADLFDLVTGLRLIGREEHSIIPARLSFISERRDVLQEELAEFEWLINKTSISEHEIQRFFEVHPHFLLGIEYKRLHSQLTLVREDRADLRPDFFLERLDGEFCDIVDLKLPSSRVVVGTPNRRTFSSAVISALGQLREYRNYFDDSANRRLFNSTYGLMAYKPRVHVIIGRCADFKDYYERQDLQDEISHLNILTFDDILARVKQQRLLIT